MEFVNRIIEQKHLQEVLNAEKSTFTVVYGRRRLGKSTLLSKILDKKDVYFLADQTEAKLQRELLATVITSVIPDFNQVQYPDWNVFFDMLNTQYSVKLSGVSSGFRAI